VDPARNVTSTIGDERIRIISDYFPSKHLEGVKADVVVANNVFAHIEDLNGVTAAVAALMEDDGVFVFEVNRLDSMIADLQYDWVYHEHLFYFSLIALERLLERHGLQVYDLKRIGTHAGSIRYYACKSGMTEETPAVQDQRDKEYWHGLSVKERFTNFAQAAADHRDAMRQFVDTAKTRGQKVAGYGACGRSNTMIQFCGFTADDIDFIVDDAPAKQGFYTPGSHIPIRSNHYLLSQPDKLIVFAWSFLDEIYGRCGHYQGDIIIPLPQISVSSMREAA
jgi:hypothetical protein